MDLIRLEKAFKAKLAIDYRHLPDFDVRLHHRYTYMYICIYVYHVIKTSCKYIASRVLVHTVDLNCNFSDLFVWFDPNRSTSFGRITVFEDVLRWSRVSGLWSSTKDASRSFFWFKPEIERWHRDTCPIERVDESLMLEDKIRKDPECKKLEKAYQKLGQQWFAQHTEIHLHHFQLFHHMSFSTTTLTSSQFVKEIPGLHRQGLWPLIGDCSVSCW